MKKTRIQAVGAILRELYRLEDLGLGGAGINKLRRETVYFLFEEGAQPKWSTKRPHSKLARELSRQYEAKLISWTDYRAQVSYEHALPLTTLAAGLRQASRDDVELEAFLDRHVRGVIVLRTEDAKLRQCGLRQALPSGSSPDDLLARYNAAGITFEEADLAKLVHGWSIYGAD